MQTPILFRKSSMKNLVIWLLVLFSASSYGSADTELASDIIAKSVELRLSKHPTWLKLLHYERGSFPKSRLVSAIHSEEFFNSPEGKSNPESELTATLQAFTYPAPDNPNQHAQCEFRGRYLWLKEMLGFDSMGLENIHCQDYEEWSLNGTTQSISLVLATGYLGNPASYYGHTLIKLNSSESNQRTPLEDVTINYGAIVPDNEGSLPYIFKGLFGGYSGGFSHIQYYYHDYNYGENELRNLWEYELDLSLDEVNLILGHSWEVLGKEYTYFFLDENCAYQMARILEVVEGIELLPKNALWTIPQTLIHNLSEAKLRERPLVKTVKYHPSRQSRLYEKYESLSKDSREAVKLVVNEIGYLESDGFDEIESSLKLRILDTLLDYYQYMRNETALGEDINNIYYSNVLAKRFDLNPGDSAFDNADPPPPHLGRKPSLVRFNNVQSTAHGYGQQLTIRPAYYDALDADQGHIENAELKMGEITISRFSDNIFLQNLDLISVESVQSSSTGLPGDKAIAWKLRLGYEQQSIACTDCLMANLSADIGYSTRFTDYAVLGSYIGFAAHDNRNGIGNLSASASLFANVRLLNDLKLRLEIDEIYNVDAKNKSESRLKLEARYSIEKNMALRFGYTKHFAEEFSIALDMYF